MSGRSTIVHEVPSAIEATATLLGMALLLAFVGFTAGRWIKGVALSKSKPPRVTRGLLCAIPSWLFLILALDHSSFPGGPIAWLAGCAYAALALSFTSGYRSGFAESLRLTNYVGLLSALILPMMFPLDELLVALGLGSALMGLALLDIVVGKSTATPAAWLSNSTSFGLAGGLATLLLVFGNEPGWIAY